MRKTRDAIRILKLNVEAYPQWAKAYDSLAEAYLLDGNNELAIRNDQKSLELNPGNQGARKKLKNIREQR